MYPKILRSLKRHIKVDEAQFHEESCMDKSWCFIKYEDNKFDYCSKVNSDELRGRILFVLESPHKEEYKDPSNISPAKGLTGKKFDLSLINFLILSQYHKQCFYAGIYEVVIINAVQYQVSLGLKPEQYRTIIFQIVWQDFARKNLIERLASYPCDDSQDLIVFNACTKGNNILLKQAAKLISDMKLSDCVKSKLVVNDSVNLNAIVQDAIDESGIVSYKSTHPSRWDEMIN